MKGRVCWIAQRYFVQWLIKFSVKGVNLLNYLVKKSYIRINDLSAVQETAQKFEIVFRDRTVPVEQLLIGKNIAWLVHLHGQLPLLLTRASDANHVRFWTCVPEGKQELAEAIGPLIAEQIRKTL